MQGAACLKLWRASDETGSYNFIPEPALRLPSLRMQGTQRDGSNIVEGWDYVQKHKDFVQFRAAGD
jgi:hypothetical protein